MEHYFSRVSANYRHHAKWAAPGPLVKLPCVLLKWIMIAPVDAPIHNAECAAAQQAVAAALGSGALPLQDEAGFVVQHRARAAEILYVCTWRGNNEVWETLFHAPPRSADFTMAARDTHTGTFCVWVLPAVLHEQRAWVRYLESARDDAARAAWLADEFAGEV